jgi:hypothetical protein
MIKILNDVVDDIGISELPYNKLAVITCWSVTDHGGKVVQKMSTDDGDRLFEVGGASVWSESVFMKRNDQHLRVKVLKSGIRFEIQ